MMNKNTAIISIIEEGEECVSLCEWRSIFRVLAYKKDGVKVGDTIEYESFGGGYGIFVKKVEQKS